MLTSTAILVSQWLIAIVIVAVFIKVVCRLFDFVTFVIDHHIETRNARTWARQDKMRDDFLYEARKAEGWSEEANRRGY